MAELEEAIAAQERLTAHFEGTDLDEASRHQLAILESWREEREELFASREQLEFMIAMPVSGPGSLGSSPGTGTSSQTQGNTAALQAELDAIRRLESLREERTRAQQAFDSANGGASRGSVV